MLGNRDTAVGTDAIEVVRAVQRRIRILLLLALQFAAATVPFDDHGAEGSQPTELLTESGVTFSFDTLRAHLTRQDQTGLPNANSTGTFDESLSNRDVPADRIEVLRALIACRELALDAAINSRDTSLKQARSEKIASLREELLRIYESTGARLDSMRSEMLRRGLPTDALVQHDASAMRELLAIDSLVSAVESFAVTADSLTGGRLLRRSSAMFLRGGFGAPTLREVRVLAMPETTEAASAPTRRFRAGRQTAHPASVAGTLEQADLDPTIDVQFTMAISDLAGELGHSPARMYEYVHNNFVFEPYLGSRKGSQQTLEHSRGNDYDQASLLIALLRSSGVPARYVRGTVEMPVDPASSWLGVEDPTTLVAMLNAAGFDGVEVQDSLGHTVAVECKRVWVEAFVPIVNYRGAVNDSTGKVWVPLDPAFKRFASSPAINLPAEIGFNGEEFVREYFTELQTETPAELFQQMLVDSLAVRYPGASYGDLIRSRSIIPETDGILPLTLPYSVLAVEDVFSEIPDSLRYSIRFLIWDSAGTSGTTFLDYTASLPELVGKQITISFVGASEYHGQVIDSAGGMFHLPFPVCATQVSPVVRVDGCDVAQGTDSTRVGHKIHYDLELISPVGAPNLWPRTTNEILGGSTHAIGLDTEDAFPARFALPTTACPEDYLSGVLHQTALNYLNWENRASDELARLFHHVLVNDVGVTVVENSLKVEGTVLECPSNLAPGIKDPYTFEWEGLVIDVKRVVRREFPVVGGGSGANCDLRWLRGANMSILENQTLERLLDREAISAVKFLEIASDRGKQICEITDNIATDCPALNMPTAIEARIDSIAQLGWDVIIPVIQQSYYNWYGAGWIEHHPATCSQGYLISGFNWGGSTAERPDSIPEMVCDEPTGPVTISPSGGVYCPESNTTLTLAVPMKHWKWDETQGCRLISTEPTHTRTESLANLGPGIHTFTFGSNGPCGCSAIDTQITVVSVTIDRLLRPNHPFDGIPPHSPIEVGVTIEPDLTGTGHAIHFDVIGESGVSGTATITANQTRTSSGTIEITGGEQTTIGCGGRLQISARLDGTGEDCATSEPFSVCAHPVDFRQSAGRHRGNGVLEFEYTWGSDCGHVKEDLGAVWVKEHVLYPGSDSFVAPNPPFAWGARENPQLGTGTVLGDEGGIKDRNRNNHDGTECILAGPEASFEGSQYFRFRCIRCVPVDHAPNENSLDWGTILDGPIAIRRFVEQVGPEWQYRIDKSGVSATRRPLPICGP